MFKFFASKSECLTKYDAFCSHIFDYACLWRKLIDIEKARNNGKTVFIKIVFENGWWGDAFLLDPPMPALITMSLTTTPASRFGFSMMRDKFCHSCFKITARTALAQFKHFTLKTGVRFRKGGFDPPNPLPLGVPLLQLQSCRPQLSDNPNSELSATQRLPYFNFQTTIPVLSVPLLPLLNNRYILSVRGGVVTNMPQNMGRAPQKVRHMPQIIWHVHKRLWHIPQKVVAHAPKCGCQRIRRTAGETYECEPEFERERRTNVCNSADVEDLTHNCKTS